MRGAAAEVLLRAVALAVACSAAACVAIVLDSKAALPQSALCGAVMGAFLAPTVLIERVARRAPSSARRALLAFGLSLLYGLVAGLLANLQISYTANYGRTGSMERALRESAQVLSTMVGGPRQPLELVAPIVFTIAALTAVRVVTRNLKVHVIVASGVAISYLVACFLLPSSWRLDDRKHFAGFAVAASLLAPLLLAGVDWLLAAISEKAQPVGDDEQRAALVEHDGLADPHPPEDRG